MHLSFQFSAPNHGEEMVINKLHKQGEPQVPAEAAVHRAVCRCGRMRSTSSKNDPRLERVVKKRVEELGSISEGAE